MLLPWARQRRPSAFLAKALGGANHPAPQVINTDKHAGYPPAIVQLKAEAGLFPFSCWLAYAADGT